MHLDDIPEDVLHIIADYLPPSDLLAFCSITHSLHDNTSIRFSSSYWSRITRNTFRVPNQPVVEHDGHRWMQLYRRMRTQTKIYSWGNNDLGCLGGALQLMARVAGAPRVVNAQQNGRLTLWPKSRSWPERMYVGDVGVVADLQCGGWSTTALSSKGQLFTVGVIDGLGRTRIPSPVPHTLEYPAGFVRPDERYDAYTAIKQFSAGRCHVLGLSDSGRIWSWSDTALPGVHVKFLLTDVVESQTEDLSRKDGYVRKVVAGWNRSSAYIIGKGIVCWEPSNNAELQGHADQSGVDGMLVLESWIVPGTSYLRPTKRGSDSRGDPKHSEIGEVTSWILLEAYVVFTTHTGGLYATRLPSSPEDMSYSTTRAFHMNGRLDYSLPEYADEQIVDVQGSFRSFAIFKRSGSVLLGDQDYLHVRIGAQTTSDGNSRGFGPPPTLTPDAAKLRKIPALQNSGVLALGFGDWHTHALHSDGTISSYGQETDFCGALGLGGKGGLVPRGLDSMHNFMDGMLMQECLTSGRRVWFEAEKQTWLDWLIHVEGTDPRADECKERRGMMRRRTVKAEVSEWFEERLRRWEVDAPAMTKATVEGRADEDDDGLPAYFALNVAAAGWHSGALVLVNEAKAERIRACYRAREEEETESTQVSYSVLDMAKSLFSSFVGLAEQQEKKPTWIWEQEGETFPRLRLKDGETLPGTVKVLELPDHLRKWETVELVDL